MTLSNAAPPLLSLSVRRTVDSLLTMSTTPPIKSNDKSKKLINKQREEQQVDHAIEFQTIHGMLEQQCFEIVALNNKIHDARRNQGNLLTTFHARTEELENRLSNLSSMLLQKVEDLNHRIDIINKTLTPKPILTKFLPQNAYGRITGVDTKGDFLTFTTAQGYIIVIDRIRDYKVLSENVPFPGESLFSPTLISRQNISGLFTVSSARRLLFAVPARSMPKQIVEGRVESFSAVTDGFLHESYDLVTGHQNSINFFQFQENYNGLNLIGSLKRLNGTVLHILTDVENEAVYALTSRRFFYSVSSSSFGIIYQHIFNQTPLQIQLSTVFIIISFAPNDIFIVERNREKMTQLTKIEIKGGLRCFFCGENQLFIVTKQQKIERRRLCKPQESEIICEPDVADYDENEYIGTIFSDGLTIYLSHGNRISIWV